MANYGKKNQYVETHEELLNERFKANLIGNNKMTMQDINSVYIDTYNMGKDTGADNALDDVETVARKVSLFGMGALAGACIGKAIYRKFFTD